MILSYKFENFMSFRENVEFSMLAPKSKVKNRFPNNYMTSKTGVDLLKTAVIVGENAGGKSNFVTSLGYLQSFFLGTSEPKLYRNIINANYSNAFCPLENDIPQSFELELLIEENILYSYHLALDVAGIVTETFAFKNLAKKEYKKIFSLKKD